jgi:hypothetical protein
VMRVREWYGWHFPELVKIVNDNYQYARVGHWRRRGLVSGMFWLAQRGQRGPCESWAGSNKLARSA